MRQVLGWAAFAGGTLAGALAALLFLAPGMGFTGRPARVPGAAGDGSLTLAPPAPVSPFRSHAGLGSRLTAGPGAAGVVAVGLSPAPTGPVPAGSDVAREHLVPSAGADVGRPVSERHGEGTEGREEGRLARGTRDTGSEPAKAAGPTAAARNSVPRKAPRAAQGAQKTRGASQEHGSGPAGPPGGEHGHGRIHGGHGHGPPPGD
jgi:hypothetical protein